MTPMYLRPMAHCASPLLFLSDHFPIRLDLQRPLHYDSTSSQCSQHTGVNVGEEQYSVDDLIRDIREILSHQGPVGEWLLRRIDDSLEYGIEDWPSSEVRQQRWPDDLEHEVAEDSELISRKPRDGWELLERYLDLLEAYLVKLPACFDSAAEQLRDGKVPDAKLVLYNELAPDVPGQSPQVLAADDMFPFSWHRNADMFLEVRRVLGEIVHR